MRGTARLARTGTRNTDAASILLDGVGCFSRSHGIAGRVFEPFFTTKARAAGLGLTTAREALLALGADLILDEAAQGAAFVVTLKAGRSGPVKEQ